MFDTLKGDYDGIILDDCVCDNPLGLSDNYVCRVYRRNRNSPPWTGQYFIVLSNLPFETWLEKCGVTDEENVKAAYDRAYLCAVKFREDGVKYLSLKKLSTRGKKEDQMARVDMFMDFQKKFNESIAQYNPKDEMVDYTELIDPEYWTRTQKARMAENAALKSQGIHLHSVYDNNTERSYALRSFGEWFWSDPDYSPWVAYVKSKRPARLDVADALCFIRKLPVKKLKDTVSQYIDYKMVQTFDIEFVRDVIEWTIDPTGE